MIFIFRKIGLIFMASAVLYSCKKNNVEISSDSATKEQRFLRVLVSDE